MLAVEMGPRIYLSTTARALGEELALKKDVKVLDRQMSDAVAEFRSSFKK